MAKECLNLTYSETLESSYTLVETMMQEYAYICNERNRASKGEDDNDENEWITMPDFESGGMKRMKKGNL